MAPKIVKKNVESETSVVKAKRGRKSKKELMESLNMKSIINDKSINLCVNEINLQNLTNPDNDSLSSENIYSKILEPLDENKNDNNIIIISN
jgi:hypothetical protein